MKFACTVLSLVALLLLAVLVACNPGPPFRRLPFNGSMYGKRTGNALPMDYDSNSKALSSLCEMAVEVCPTWFPQQQENN
ncbi:neuropeptide SIFamide-like [Periplaneta americana]|uniref:neuropeptide SIFamide-like n=1 Tax=Periplaneta americana TaxID=6978 RepID=UPI0037E8F372